MRMYDESLVTRLMEVSLPGETFGTSLSIRPVPDAREEGFLDPRERPYGVAFLENAKKGGGFSLEGVRRATGNVNYNLNTQEILTDLVTLPGGARMWVYTPRKPFDKADRPAVLYIHGGSFFAGTPFMCENLCRLLAEKAQAVVFNLDYALAPERPFPAGVEDCLAAFAYIEAHTEEWGVDPRKLCVAGDSAGGCLAATVSQQCENVALAGLFYPNTTFQYFDAPFEWKESDFDFDPREAMLVVPKLCLGRSDGKGNDALMLNIKNMYLQKGEDHMDPKVSPLVGDLSQACPTFIATAEYDGLRPQGEYYARLLREAGQRVTLLRYRGVYHAFMEKLGILPQAEACLLEFVKEIHAL